MKRITSHILAAAAALLAGTAAATAQTITVAGHEAVLDSLTSTYLCPITKAQFGSTLSAVVTHDCPSMTIDGTPVASGDTYDFEAVAGSKQWRLDMVTPGDSTTVTRYITFTYLPVMVMTGDFGYEYTQGNVRLLDPDRYNATDMLARVKWRGGTTNVEGKHKRNYHIKFVDSEGNKMDRKLLGLRNDNSWIMDAGQVDFLRVRNRVATQLWNDMAHLPYYAAQEPKVKTGVDGGMVEVILNGKYAGFYALTEAMDRKTLRLKKYDETTGHIHGQLWKTTGLNTTVTFNTGAPYDNTQETWKDIETKYPELDDVYPTEYKTLSDAIWLADTADEAQFNRHAHELFDMPVMIDYEIFLQVLLGVDNYGKNIYWAVYDRDISPMLTLAVWDLDATMGGNWNSGQYHPTNLSPTRNVIFAHGVFKRICRPFSIYYKQGIERYQELRQGILSTDSLIARYTDAVAHVNDCGAVAREQARWSGDSDLSRRRLDIVGVELPYVTQWIRERMEHLDKTRFATPIPGDVNADGIVDVTDINLIINTMLETTDALQYVSADVNGDSIIDVSDVNEVVNIVLKNKIKKQ